MLRFNKGFLKNTSTKIATNYSSISEADKIKEIKNRMYGNINIKQNNNLSNTNLIRENKDVYNERINALKNIKKD